MKFTSDFIILSNTRVSADYFVLKLLLGQKLPDIKPGQFVQVKVKNSPPTFLRRPFSIHDVDYAENTINLYIKIAGPGTEKLSEAKVGDRLDVVFPLGNSFIITENKNVLLVGGGCGVAPLLLLAKTLEKNGNKVTTLIGGRCRSDVYEVSNYFVSGKLLCTTEDASFGEKGFVTNHSLFKAPDQVFDRYYACGPEPMLKAVARIARERNIECEVSLENTMACGFGVCLCCVVDTITGNRCVCTEGPVFNIKDLKW